MSMLKEAVLGWLNPLPTEGISHVTDTVTPRQVYNEKRKLDDMLKAAAKTGLGWAGAMFATRLAIDAVSSTDNSKRQKKFKEYAAARSPIIQMKTAADSVEQNSYWDPVRTFIHSFTREDKHTLHIAATLAAATGGATIGWKLADRLADRRKSSALDKQIGTNQADLDNLLSEEYQRTRGIGKYASQEPTKDPTTSWLKGVKVVYPIYVAGMLALAYKLSKDTMDSTDPRRQRIKSLEEFARQKSLLETSPVLISNAIDLPEAKGALKAKKGTVQSGLGLPMGTSPQQLLSI